MSTGSLQPNSPPTDAKPRRRPGRMAALATLPVFFTLAGKRVLVAGGTAAAAWKAELLAATGADVHVYADELDPVFEALIASGAAAGSLVHHAFAWRQEELSGATIAVCDAQSDDEAAAFVHAAKAAGVPFNVIDRPEFCQFSFGSIVNRSPVVIGISTSGAAPILGQAVRRRIEALIPPALARWADLARRMRAVVLQRLKAGGQRRAFWETLSDRAFGAPPDAGAADALLDECRRIACSTDPALGRVTLVGAGPGDAELLTLKAVRALQAADVILFDDHVSDEVLELARREAKRLAVGSRDGRRSRKMEDINALIVKSARSGKHVVRLQAGDPMTFDHAGEEITRLRDAGLPVVVVPGITAGYQDEDVHSGICTTRRDDARLVRSVNGPDGKVVLPERDFLVT